MQVRVLKRGLQVTRFVGAVFKVRIRRTFQHTCQRLCLAQPQEESKRDVSFLRRDLGARSPLQVVQRLTPIPLRSHHGPLCTRSRHSLCAAKHWRLSVRISDTMVRSSPFPMAHVYYYRDPYKNVGVALLIFGTKKLNSIGGLILPPTLVLLFLYQRCFMLWA